MILTNVRYINNLHFYVYFIVTLHYTNNTSTSIHDPISSFPFFVVLIYTYRIVYRYSYCNHLSTFPQHCDLGWYPLQFCPFPKDVFDIRDTNCAVIPCLLYTSDAADERSSVDLGGRRIIKKKKSPYN